MASRVLLHVGPPKTGTTFLQGVVWENRDRLAADGIRLPLEDRRSNFLATASLCDPRWADERGAETWTWDRLVEDVTGHPGDVLVSDEVLSLATTADASRAARDLDGRELHVVLTLRDLGRLVPSMWQQDVKLRETRTLEEYVADLAADPQDPFWTRHDPAGVLRRWTDHVPAERMHVVTLPPGSGDASELWHRFAEVLGVDGAGYRMPQGSGNVSFGATQVEVLRRLNAGLGHRLPAPQPYVRAIRFGLITGMEGGSQTGRIGMDPRWHPWLAERTEQMVAELRHLGVHLVGDWADLLPAEPRGADHPTDAEVADAAVEAMTVLAERYNTRREQVFRLQDKLAREQARVTRLRRRLRATGGNAPAPSRLLSRLRRR